MYGIFEVATLALLYFHTNTTVQRTTLLRKSLYETKKTAEKTQYIVEHSCFMHGKVSGIGNNIFLGTRCV